MQQMAQGDCHPSSGGLLPSEIIKRKRDGQALRPEEIRFMVSQYTSDALPDYQMSAFLMSVFFQGMSDAETVELTRAMLESGKVLDFSNTPSFKVDKHSTGGVGDKTSLILGPIVHALGLRVPMISGRGLGHTGGTLDKLESIPGFSTQLSLEKFQELISGFGMSYIGQTKDICPADKKIYALRDVTATIESLPLICASILSKKLAEGIDGLVLDVKFGSGAFMKTLESAETLALALSSLAKKHGKKVAALLTNMNQPLGRFAGNSLEIEECLHILEQSYPRSGPTLKLYQETEELSLWLSAYMLMLAEPQLQKDDAYKRCLAVLKNGKALESFKELCRLQGGDLSKIPKAQHKKEVFLAQEGFVCAIHTENIGYAGIELRAGRTQTTDTIEPTAGIEFHAKIGDFVKPNSPVATIYGNNPSLFSAAEKRLSESYALAKESPTKPKLIEKIIF